jgi:hypothetical protein
MFVVPQSPAAKMPWTLVWQDAGSILMRFLSVISSCSVL